MSKTKTLPFCDIPAVLLSASNRRAAARSAVSVALYHKLDPLPLVGNETRESIHLAPGLAARIQAVADAHGMSFQDAWGGLLRAGIAHMTAEADESAKAAESEDNAPFTLRPGEAGIQQNQYWRNVMSSLRRGRIVVAEASTGLGKGRVIVGAALERASEGVRPVIVAAPTLKILAQLWVEYERLRDENPDRWGHVKCAFLPGLSEFVDPQKLREQIEGTKLMEEPVDEAVHAWLASGGKPLSSETAPLMRALLAVDAPMSFLTEDLRRISTTISPSSVLLESGEDERVKASRAAARDADVVFCTHAMVGQQIKSNWASLDGQHPRCVLIDEAHELERHVANVFSASFAIRAVRRSVATTVAAGKMSRTAGKRLQSALRKVEEESQRLSQLSEGESVRLDASTSPEFKAAIARLLDCMNAKPARVLPRAESLRIALAHLSMAFSGATNKAAAWLEFSPTRRYPNILAGRASVAGVLGLIWKSADAGVALCSASLFIPDASGNQRADYIVETLALPRHLVDTPQPVLLRFITAIPKMHTPGVRVATVLARPNRAIRDDASESRWLSAVATMVKNIVCRPSIAGGTLVLLTSYAQVNAVRDALFAEIPDRLVWQQPSERFADAQRRYEAIYRAGGKPVLLGLGAAWTGVDLSDHELPAVADRMLTDLIIGCLPVGLNRSPTMLDRIERAGTRPIERESLMLLRQGLGRLMRRDGVEDRHIWMLDGRLWMRWPGMEQYQASALEMLKAYKKQASLSIK
jgi:ATP-dependent DNA helicase DinG